MATETPKKPRAKKRNFSQELSAVRTYCEMKIDVLAEVGGAEPTEFSKGQRFELTAILKKMEVAK